MADAFPAHLSRRPAVAPLWVEYTFERLRSLGTEPPFPYPVALVAFANDTIKAGYYITVSLRRPDYANAEAWTGRHSAMRVGWIRETDLRSWR